MLGSVVETLAGLRGIAVAELLEELSASLKDVLFIQFLGADLSGSIRFDLAARFLSRATQLLGAAACAESKPGPYFMKATNAGKEFVQQCRLAHTVPGSFGFRIESPLEEAASIDSTLLQVESPFRRRVLERIMGGLLTAEEAVLTQNPDRITAAYDTGLNANMCDTLAEVVELAAERNTEISASWSPLLPSPLRGMKVRLTPAWRPVLTAASSNLRQVPLLKRVSILGRIVALRSGPDENQIQIESREHGRKVTVRVSLPHHQYRQACDAHRDEQIVAVQGVLEKQGKHWVLSAPDRFQVVPPEQLLLEGRVEEL